MASDLALDRGAANLHVARRCAGVDQALQRDGADAMSNSIRRFVFARLAEGSTPMAIQKDAEERFGHCGWLYVLRLKKEYERTKDAP